MVFHIYPRAFPHTNCHQLVSRVNLHSPDLSFYVDEVDNLFFDNFVFPEDVVNVGYHGTPIYDE